MRIGNLPAYYHGTKETLGVVMIVIVPVVAPILMLLLLGRLLHSVDRGVIWLTGYLWRDSARMRVVPHGRAAGPVN